MVKYFLSFVVILFLCPYVVAQQQYSLTIPAPVNGVKGKNLYVESLLKKIFISQGYKLNIIYNPIPSNKFRTAKKLSDNENIDILWANNRTDMSQQLHAIKQPIYKGFIGFRLVIVHQKNLNLFANVNTVKNLSNFTAVQKKDWLDYEILSSNGLKVEGNMAFTAMFKAIEHQLVDYFPRSILEIDREITEFGSHLITVEPNILIKYPSLSYFYINKKNKELTNIIEKGFQAIIKNGVFEQNFQHFFGDLVKKHKLKQRQVIQLKNPYYKK
ncbi:MAG: hypothetical protein KC484_07225 [Colwelliaceae bacterium]|jgi:hypothetical protein|nr:hypothetical protein [Colwelliaceae bacterium]